MILAHGMIYDAASWAPLAVDIARNGMVALSLEEVKPDTLLAANAWLREKHGVKEVALIGASAGGSASIRAMTQSPREWDQLVLLSSVGDVRGLGPAPKLFVVSEKESMAGAVRQMAKDAPGKQNGLIVFEGSAHAQAIFKTPNGPRLTGEILGRLMKRAQPAK